jgi:hypothetical protein
MRTWKSLILAALAAGSLAVPAMAQVNNDTAAPKAGGGAPTPTTLPQEAVPTRSGETTPGAVVSGTSQRARDTSPEAAAAGGGGGSK